jgi:hypothetical protein
MDLRISRAAGVIKLDDFLTPRPANQPADYEYREGWRKMRHVEVVTAMPQAAIMFEDFATMVGNSELLEQSIRASERTQAWLDAVWNSAIENERTRTGSS